MSCVVQVIIMTSSTAAHIPATRDSWGVWWESVGSLQKPRCHHQISGSNAKLRSYRHFPCLFGGHWYLMNPYRVHTELVHMPCYHTGPFPGTPTGRASSRGTGKKVTQLPFGKEGKRTVGTRRMLNNDGIRLVRNFNFCCRWTSPDIFEQENHRKFWRALFNPSVKTILVLQFDI